MSNSSDYSDCESDYDHGHSHGSDLTEDQEDVLKFALGKKTCSDDESNRFIWFLLLAIIFTLIFILLCCSPFESMFKSRVGNYNNRLWIKALVFLFIVFVILWIADQWRQDNDKDSCKWRRD